MRWIGAVVTAAVMLLVSVASAVAAQPLIRHLRFRDSGVDALRVATDSRYAFIEPLFATAGGLGTLIDEQTGRRTELVRSGYCRDEQSPRIAAGWLVFDCPPDPASEPAPELYSLSSHTWTAVTPSPSLVGYCSIGSCVDPISAGRAWLQYSVGHCSPGEHCTAGHNEFQSLTSGELRNDPTGGRTMADVNSPDLAQRLCAPLKVPRVWDLYSGFAPGSVVMDGRFAIAFGSKQYDPVTAHLERCGSRLHLLLSQAPYADGPLPVGWNATSVIWQSGPRQLSGLFLPSLQRFRATFPRSVTSGHHCGSRDCFSEIALTNKTVYLLDSPNGRLWTAHAPRAPAKRRRH